MRILALDIGTRRTGCAFYDSQTGVPLPLETIQHDSDQALAERVTTIVGDRKCDKLIIGLPLLLSGKEGAQVERVKAAADGLKALHLPMEFLDERYTTPQHGAADADALAALKILQGYLERNGS
jgi:putative holliday junction resolvase